MDEEEWFCTECCGSGCAMCEEGEEDEYYYEFGELDA